ncbi:MAG: restriction endonuclease subunit S [Sediminicola sp.]
MSSNEWQTYKLEQVLEVKYGKDHKALSDGDIPVYGSGGIMRFANKALYQDTSILIPRKGTLNNLFFLDKPFWTVDTMFYTILDRELIDPKFLFYKLTTFNYSEMNVGTAVPSMTVQVLNELEITIPEKPIQEKISFILSSIDDKIENNLATNQTLEEIARTLFKEWFVNFNYPNADGNLKHSEFGEIPESWSIGTLSDIYKTTSGGTPSRSKSEYYENGTIGWVKSKELNNSFIIDTEEKITEDALKNSSAKLLPKHSVLIAMYGATVSEIGVTTKEFTCNQAICSFLPNENYPFSFIYNFLLHSKKDIIGRAVGSAQQNISQQVLLQFKLVIPPSELVQEYHRIVFPLFQKIQDNIEENESLRDLRDSLLPKLMSGEIDANPSNAQ